jgi:hypothetical protein
VNVAVSLGVEMRYAASADIRADIAASMPDAPGYSTLNEIVFRHPLPARSWLQVSNPSERWKWDFLYQDVPPVKFQR